MAEPYDLIIVGGGMVGASLACALKGSKFRIALIEAVPFDHELQPSYDARAIVLSYGTRRIFEGLGLWPAIVPNATAIRHIHISERGGFGITRLDAAAHGLPALGYVVEGRALGRVLGKALAGIPNLNLICPAQLKSFSILGSTLDQAAEVTIETAQGLTTLQARLVVGADGGRSALRELAGIAADTVDYQQNAVITTVTPALPHQGVAYERFTDTGPLALLPLSEQRCGLVWTVPREQLGEVLALDDQAFMAGLQDRFGGRLGKFRRVGARRAYPLVLVRAREQVRPRLALIGNAAHALHPVAGQGFNLGLRDVAALAEVLSEAAHSGRDPGDLTVLQRYQRWRSRDQSEIIAFTDRLSRLFSNGFGPLVLARNLGLLALDLATPVKQVFSRRAMGLSAGLGLDLRDKVSGHLPRLARGLSLST